MSDSFLVFGSPEIEEVIACMESGSLSTGPRVARFEDDFRAYKGDSHAVTVKYCIAAFQLSLLVTALNSGDDVISTSLSFCSTVNAILNRKKIKNG